MTRYTRLGKSTHQRVAGDPTSWKALKSTPQKEKKRPEGNTKRTGGSRRIRGFNPKRDDQMSASANFTELGKRQKNVSSDAQPKSVKGYGKSKVIQIFGQFWVPVDDAKRLQGLVKKLKTQGLSRKEILAALQNERRRAEKAAKRIRDKTCYGCRQFGHVLSDCPKASVQAGSTSAEDLIEQETPSGICFKCGTTEHSSRNCKKKGDTFTFAKCFICSQVGHISRQCAENTQGIYPSGGECNICKELTHLAKDCPAAVTGKPVASSAKGLSVDGDRSLPVMSKLSDPFACTEYETAMDEGSSEAKSKPKKRRVKF